MSRLPLLTRTPTTNHPNNNHNQVTELPVKKWTQDYKQFLESMTVGASDEKGAFVKVSEWGGLLTGWHRTARGRCPVHCLVAFPHITAPRTVQPAPGPHCSTDDTRTGLQGAPHRLLRLFRHHALREGNE